MIVKNDEFVVFVEVKVRKNANFAFAREFVGHLKQEKMKATANIWLTNSAKKNNLKTNVLQPRFDVIEIYSSNERMKPEINHIENAF